MQQNATAAGAVPQTPLGELNTVISQTSSWFLGRCFAERRGGSQGGRERERRGRKGEAGEGQGGRRREGEGWKREERGGKEKGREGQGLQGEGK